MDPVWPAAFYKSRCMLGPVSCMARVHIRELGNVLSWEAWVGDKGLGKWRGQKQLETAAPAWEPPRQNPEQGVAPGNRGGLASDRNLHGNGPVNGGALILPKLG